MEFKITKVRVGQVVEGTVFYVTDDVCYVDIPGAFADGVIYKEGLSLGKSSITSCKEVVKEGDVLDFKVNKIDYDNQSILLNRIDMLRNENRIKMNEEIKSTERLTAKVTKITRGGLILRYKDLELFMPLSHIDNKRVNAEDFAGKELVCKVIEQDERRIVVSRKLVLSEDYKLERAAEFEKMAVGDILDGVVTKVLDFGAFVRVGKSEGLLHRSEVSHYRFKGVDEVLKEGDKVTVQIIKKENKKIGLSIKSMSKAPWELFAETHKVGDEVTGKIVKKMATGMLVEIEREVAGILSSKDYSWNPQENLAGTVEVGSELTLKLLSLDPVKNRMSLSKKHLDYNPWQDVTVKVGEEISGVVEELQSKGALVKVSGVKAFLPISEITADHVNEIKDVIKVDDVINAVVLELDKRNWKMKISVKQLKEKKEAQIFEKYKESEKMEKQTLGDLFKDKFSEFK
jgi:small subunit ribosomal protein S1